VTRRPIPPHGSEPRYKGSKNRPPCRCRTCIDGWTRAGQKRLLGRLQGRPATIPAEPITQHLQTLYAANMTPQQIADLSGADASTVRAHAAGAFPTIRRTTAEKLLAVQPGQQPSDGWVSALGAIRRCRALYTLGHGAKAIAAAHPALQLRTVEYVVRGKRQHLTVAVHNTICEVYRALCHIPGASYQAKLRAATEGWHGPLAWDDIDNPHCQPETSGNASDRSGKTPLDLERVARMTAIGKSAGQIAEELGCHKRSVVRARRRAEELAVAA
jgi:DNA-binding CsgD family transcriptional regulator